MRHTIASAVATAILGCSAFVLPLPLQGQQLTQQDSVKFTNEWAIRLKSGVKADYIVNNYGAELLFPVGLPQTYAFRFEQAQTDSTAAQLNKRLAEDSQVEWFERQQVQTAAKRNIPTDPLYANQWHLKNTGQSPGVAGNDAKVEPAWQLGYLGTGINMTIVDDGVQHSHPDLIANRWTNPNEIAGNNIDDDGNGLIDDVYGWNFNGNNNNPEGVNGDNHGTACAGVAAAKDNTLGGVGAAYRAKHAGIRLIASGYTDAQAAAALSYKNNIIHISSNSWGPTDNGQLATGTYTLQLQAIANSAANGRNGRGTLFSWAAGNGLGSQDNVNYDPLANSRFTIAVGATGDAGTQASYSEPGAAMLINAPSNGNGAGITTTDRVGTEGYNTAASGSGGDYTNTFGGTSSACPLVSGILALMLEANPNLGWRDAQHILVNTAFQNHPSDADWRVNGAGRMVNHKYGFGRIDAEKVVRLAPHWINVPAADSFATSVQSVNQAIPDNNTTGIVSTITVPSTLTIEHVEIIFSATHTRRGDLRVVLVSPSGTESVLAETRTTDNGSNYSSWKFMSVRHWGERANGTWTLRVTDERSANTGTFGSWQLIIHGTPNPVQPTLVAPAPFKKGVPTSLGFHWQPMPGAVSYQFQVSTNANFTSTVVNQTVTLTTTAVQNLVVNQDYFWRVRANLASTTSNWSQVRNFSTVPPPTGGTVSYCTPTYENLCSSGDFIRNFSFAGIVNNNSNCNGNTNNYIFYNNLTANVTAGQGHAVSIQGGTEPQGFAIWIDYNRNGEFENTEQVFTAASSTTVQTGTITVPANVANGQTRMRVRSQWNVIPNSPCNQLNYGETEDYVVNISGGASAGFELSGYVLGDVFGGVQVQLSGTTTTSATTGPDGFYAFNVTAGTYTITPSLAGFTFSPVTRTVTVASSLIGQNFSSTQGGNTSSTFSVSGAISGVQNNTSVQISLQGGFSTSATLIGNGNYVLNNIPNGNYTVTASAAGFTFAPSTRSIVMNNGNIVGQDFAATPLPAPTYSISGAVSGVTTGTFLTVSISGTAATGATINRNLGFNNAVTYIFNGIPNGTYSVSVTAANYSFAPVNRTVTVSNANISGQDFTGTPTGGSTPPWTVSGNTGNNHTIIWLTSSTVTIGNRSVQVGDAIGYFYTNGSTSACAGFAIWNGSNTSITVWGDDSQTGAKDGFNVGENLTARIWDAAVGRELPATLTYASGPSTYQVNGISNIGTATAITADTFRLAVSTGWNLVSSNVSSANMSMGNVLTGTSQIFLIKNNAGQNYFPTLGIFGIPTWNITEGYQLYANGPDTLRFIGNSINTVPITLPTGWNMVSYLRKTSMNIATALAGISAQVVLVKNNAGQNYLPGFGINQIGNMLPGQGYQIYVNAPVTLVYPANTKTIAEETEVIRMPENFVSNVQSSVHATIIVEGLQPNAREIAAYTIAGRLVGSAVVANGKAALTVWGADEISNAGANHGEEISLRVLTDSGIEELTATEIRNIVTGESTSKLLFRSNTILAMQAQQARTEQGRITPNPAAEQVTITVTGIDKTADIIIRDAVGREVARMSNINGNSGELVYQMSVANFVNGVYWAEIIPIEGERKLLRFVVQR